MSKYITTEQVNNAVALCKDEPFSKASVFAITELLPSADVVEVVRCKNCKYFKPYENTGFCDKAIALLGELNFDAYCCYGERKDNETET